MIRYWFALIIALALATPAWAQTQLPGPTMKPVAPPAKFEQRNREPPPPALPGSRAEPAAVAPATRAPVDLPPTEALFDAINRGDLAVAKDAVSRGADFRGRNVLGLTPLELSVDLGRNAITFYLLSLRGDTTTEVPAEPSKSPVKAASRPEPRPRRQAALKAAEIAPTTPQTARLFADDGGAPALDAGFLGFNPTR